MEKVEDLSKDTLEFIKRTVEAVKCEKTDWPAMKVMCVARQETNKRYLERPGRTNKELVSLENQRLDLGICQIMIDIFCD
jgi:hypothetical protein